MADKKKRSQKKHKPTPSSKSVEELSPSADSSLDASLSGRARSRSEPNSLARQFSFLLLLVIIAIIGVLSYRVMRSFVLPLFLAALLVVIFRPVYEWIQRRCGGRKSLAAGLTTAAILLVVLGPVAWMLVTGVREGEELTRRDWKSDMAKLNVVREKFGLEMPFGKDLEEIQTQLQSLQLSEDRTGASVAVQQKLQLVSAIRGKLSQFKTMLSETSVGHDSLEERVEMTLPTLMEMDAPLVRLQDLVKQAEAGVGIASPDEVNEYVDEYEELVDVINGKFTAARRALMGGAWSPVVELVNPSEERIDQWQGYAAEQLRGWMLKLTGQATSIMGGLLMQLFIFAISTFYFLADGPQMISSAMQLSPMDDEHEAEIISEFAKLSRAVVVATLLSAIVQGLLAGIGYFTVWGFDSLFMLIMLTTILAMIPFVGAAAVWVPACIYLAFVEDRIPAAIGLAIYGASVVSMADNVIKPMVLKGQSNLHPLFALLSVLGGVQALGPIGVLVGPMVVAFLQSLLKILHKEMQRMGSTVAT